MVQSSCQQCGNTIESPQPGQQYCARACALAAVHAARRVQRRSAQCAWGECPTPDVLLSLKPSDGEGPHYHGKCYKAFLQSGALRKGTGKGAVAICEICSKEIGYRHQGTRKVKYHQACYRASLKTRWSPTVKKLVACTCAECGATVSRPPHRAQAPNHFCSVAHRIAWRKGKGRGLWRVAQVGPRIHVTCTGCREVRAFRVSEFRRRRTIDHEQKTWQCLRCRKMSEQCTFTCAFCQAPFDRVVPRPDPAIRHFCCKEHRVLWQRASRQPDVMVVCPYCQIEAQAGKRSHDEVTFPMRRSKRNAGPRHFCSGRHLWLYLHEKRRRRAPCAQCGRAVPDTKQKFCCRACYIEAKRGSANPHWRPSQAEQRVLEHWASGVRGVRPLAAAAWVSKTTVQRLYKLGRLVEPVAVARSA